MAPIPDSVRLLILESLVTRISAPMLTLDGVTYDRPAGLTVMRERLQELGNKEDLPLAMVYIDEEAGERVGGTRGPLTQRLLDVIVEVMAEVPRSEDEYEPEFTNDPIEDVTDPLLSWVLMTVMADERLGGIANGIQEVETVWQSDFADIPIAGAGIRFTVSYHTRANNLTRRA